MTEQQAREAVRPLGNVDVLPSEQTRPGLTPAQKMTLDQISRPEREVHIRKVLVDGTRLLDITMGEDTTEHTLYRDGVVI